MYSSRFGLGLFFKIKYVCANKTFCVFCLRFKKKVMTSLCSADLALPSQNNYVINNIIVLILYARLNYINVNIYI